MMAVRPSEICLSNKFIFQMLVPLSPKYASCCDQQLNISLWKVTTTALRTQLLLLEENKAKCPSMRIKLIIQSESSMRNFNLMLILDNVPS